MKKLLLCLALYSGFSVMAQEVPDNKVMHHVKHDIPCSGVSFSEDKDVTFADLKEQQFSVQFEIFKEKIIDGSLKIQDLSSFNIVTLNHQRSPIVNIHKSIYPVSITDLEGKQVFEPALEYTTGLVGDVKTTVVKNSDNIHVQLCLSNTEELPSTSKKFPNLETYSKFLNFEIIANSPVIFKLDGDRVLKIQVTKI